MQIISLNYHIDKMPKEQYLNRHKSEKSNGRKGEMSIFLDGTYQRQARQYCKSNT